jgi:uncharacterized protein (DUF433 family)
VATPNLRRGTTIARDEDILGGEPRIGGTRVGVRHVAARVIDAGQSPAYVADQLDISLRGVRGALVYYDQKLPDDDPEGLARTVDKVFTQYGSSGIENEPVDLDEWYDWLYE